MHMSGIADEEHTTNAKAIGKSGIHALRRCPGYGLDVNVGPTGPLSEHRRQTLR
jgi:hypothetical protein